MTILSSDLLSPVSASTPSTSLIEREHVGTAAMMVPRNLNDIPPPNDSDDPYQIPKNQASNAPAETPVDLLHEAGQQAKLMRSPGMHVYFEGTEFSTYPNCKLSSICVNIESPYLRLSFRSEGKGLLFELHPFTAQQIREALTLALYCEPLHVDKHLLEEREPRRLDAPPPDPLVDLNDVSIFRLMTKDRMTHLFFLSRTRPLSARIDLSPVEALYLEKALIANIKALYDLQGQPVVVPLDASKQRPAVDPYLP